MNKSDSGIKKYVIEQLRLHPSTKAQDIIKQCYQAVFGAEHFLQSVSEASVYFDKEYESTEPMLQQLLFEEISDVFCRVNIGKWKALHHSKSELFELFIATAVESRAGKDVLLELLKEVSNMISKEEIDFKTDEWSGYLETYIQMGMPTIHHSEEYRWAEKPGYRVVKRELLEKKGYRNE